MRTAPLEGVLSAAFTPVSRDGSFDASRMAAHCQHLLADGCNRIALLGTTGEANNFSTGERKAILEAVVSQGVAGDELAPGTGVCSFTETADLTRHALSVGVTTVLVLPPFYYKGVGDEGLYEYYSRVIDGTGDTRLRIVLYHIPQMSAVPLSDTLIARLIQSFPGTIVGVKDSSGDLDHMRGLIKTFPNLAIFAGADHLLGPILRAGGAGCITATSNLIAPLLAQLFAQVREGADDATTQALEARIATIRGLFQRWPQIPALKAAHGLRSGDGVWRNVRPPMEPLGEDQVSEMRTAMTELGLL